MQGIKIIQIKETGEGELYPLHERIYKYLKTNSKSGTFNITHSSILDMSKLYDSTYKSIETIISNLCKSKHIVVKEFIRKTRLGLKEKPGTKEYAYALNLRSKYGITIDEYNSLYNLQDGVCAICGSDDKLHVDHDHKTGKVRGLLCDSCNHGLGKFKDNKDILGSAITYLERN